MTPRLCLPLCLIAAFALGAYLRLDQIAAQVLIDDEWHLVHQITYYPPAHIALSFGAADYSIPLALLNCVWMRWFGVSELSLRMPMLIAGILTVVLLPLGLRGKVGDRTIALFALLLALSPFLVSYSRIARSYALTLPAIYVAYWLFERVNGGTAIRWKATLGYGLLCGLIVWTHPVTGPMVVAPILARAWTTWRSRRPDWRPLLASALAAGIAIALAVLPPLVKDPAALAGKSGVDGITLETLDGALFLWLGTGSRVLVCVCIVLTAIGWKTVWCATPLVRWATLGSALTALVLYVIRPWWVDHSLAFGRYLLPAVPLLLLAVAAGVVRVADAARRATGMERGRVAWTLALATPLLAGLWVTSPTPELLARPNSYTQHSFFQYDYRNKWNAARNGTSGISRSAFWATLADRPPGSITVAVAPFRYASFEWPAPIWERESHQRVVPAYLWGACTQSRHGEVPPDERFAFRNAVHVADRTGMVARGVDYLAYFRPVRLPGMSAPLPECEAWVREHYGPPVYEDAALLAWRLR